MSIKFVNAFSAGEIYAQYPEFAQCVTFGQQQNSDSVQVAAPQDILAAELPAPKITSIQSQAAPTKQSGSGTNLLLLHLGLQRQRDRQLGRDDRRGRS